jgi:hypothetical protein
MQVNLTRILSIFACYRVASTTFIRDSYFYCFNIYTFFFFFLFLFFFLQLLCILILNWQILHSFTTIWALDYIIQSHKNKYFKTLVLCQVDSLLIYLMKPSLQMFNMSLATSPMLYFLFLRSTCVGTWGRLYPSKIIMRRNLTGTKDWILIPFQLLLYWPFKPVLKILI